MATDGPTPAPCNDWLYRHGETVGVFDTFGANNFEFLVKAVAAFTGKELDWHYVGGRAVVKARPEDVEEVEPALCAVICAVHDALRPYYREKLAGHKEP